MDWLWLLLPVGLVAGVCGGLWIRSRTKTYARAVAGAYGGAATSQGGDGGGGDGSCD